MNVKTVIRFKVIIFLALLSFSANASVGNAKRLYEKNKRGTKYYPAIASELARSGFNFAATPFIKEYLISKNRLYAERIDSTIDKIVTAVGVKQFEVLPSSILAKSKAPMMRYILAKKYFREGKYNDALQVLSSSIPGGHPIKPFASHLIGSIYSLTKRYGSAIAAYRECINLSNARLGGQKSPNRIRQLKINRDYCVIGIPRTEFATRNFERANLHYLDLPKDSYVWPEILFEEAWNSFYMRDYNRTLGKLVTYKAPVFTHIFNPEIDVLTALTYMELCLWADAKKAVNNFYRVYQRDAKRVDRFLRTYGKNYKYFYMLAKSAKDGKPQGNSLLGTILAAIVKNPSYLELHDAFMMGKKELGRIKKLGNNTFKKILLKNLKTALQLQRNLIGAYVKRTLTNYSQQMTWSLEGMSYIKLEVLARKKTELYSFMDENRTRGDIQYLKRNDKQYFWTFNGEFWADELGDYVFALKSECKR